MNTKIVALFMLPFIFVTGLIAQAPPFKYNVEYVCNKERVVVRYCRRDSDKPGWPATTDADNYCQVEYLDRPTNLPNVPLFKAQLQTELAVQLSSCKDPKTGQAPAGGIAAGNATAADTSITKALAAKVDITIVGLKFGDPLRLPACPLLALSLPKENCVSTTVDMADDILKGFGMETSISNDVKMVSLSTDHCPSWVTGCTAYVTVHGGKIDGVALFTNGRNSAAAVTRDLTAKYGKPTRVKSGVITPDEGNKFTINEPEWDLPGLRVRYEIVSRDEDGGERIHTNQGIVRIMTETEYQRRLKKEEAPVKNKL